MNAKDRCPDDVEIMTDLIERDPDNLVGAVMLTDALMDLRDMTFTEASAHVEKVTQAARDARDLAAAAKLLREDAPGSAELHAALIRRACIQSTDRINLVVVPGNREAIAVSTYRSNPGAFWYEWTVTVGALVVTKVAAELHARQLPQPTKKRRTVWPK